VILKKTIIGVVAFCVYYFAANAIFGTISPSMIFLGLPCPACGLTRAGILFATGNFAQSFQMHPLFVPVIVFVSIAVLVKIFKPEKMKALQIPAIFLLFILLAVYAYRMVTMFPHYQPMVINSNSMLFNIINFLRESI